MGVPAHTNAITCQACPTFAKSSPTHQGFAFLQKRAPCGDSVHHKSHQLLVQGTGKNSHGHEKNNWKHEGVKKCGTKTNSTIQGILAVGQKLLPDALRTPNACQSSTNTSTRHQPSNRFPVT